MLAFVFHRWWKSFQISDFTTTKLHFKWSHGLLILVDVLCHFSPRSTATLSSPRVFVPLIQGQVPWGIPRPCSRSPGKSATAASPRARRKRRRRRPTRRGPRWPRPPPPPLPAPPTPAASSTRTPPAPSIHVGAHRQRVPLTLCGVRQGKWGLAFSSDCKNHCSPSSKTFNISYSLFL